ncbi:helix-turn-helix transcriptional regulator, partial [Klebsiella pneumoniae]
MTMPDILINTENIFLNRGICELLSEIAKEEHIREPYSVVDYFTDILGPIDMLFTEMAAGEHYLCHPFFKKLPPHTSIFIFVATDSALQVEQLR